MRWIIVIAALFMLACSSEETVSAPDNLIPEDQFVDILVDVHLIEGAVGHVGRLEGTSIDQTYGMYRAVFEEHGVTLESFQASFEYYESDLETMSSIYDRVYTQMVFIQDELKYQAPEPQPQDSAQIEPHSEPLDSLIES